jgi:PRELI-like family.
MSEFIRNDRYVFDFDWTTVVKALWNKYPHKDLDFVIYNKVIDLKRLDDDTLFVKKVVYCKKYLFLWAYAVEEIKIDLNQKILDLQTKFIAASKCLPTDGVEKITYAALNNEPGKTLYTKLLQSKSTFQKYYQKLGTGFEKGCKIIEQRCREILSESHK